MITTIKESMNMKKYPIYGELCIYDQSLIMKTMQWKLILYAGAKKASFCFYSAV